MISELIKWGQIDWVRSRLIEWDHRLIDWDIKLIKWDHRLIDWDQYWLGDILIELYLDWFNEILDEMIGINIDWGRSILIKWDLDWFNEILD